MTLKQMFDFAAGAWGSLSNEQKGIILSAVFVWFTKPKSEEDFVKKARALRSPKAAKLLIAFARLAPDLRAFGAALWDALFGEADTPNVHRALKSLPPPPNETPKILIEGEEPKK